MNVREQLQKHMLANGISQNKVAASIGMSGAVVSQFLNSKYSGDNAVVEDAIKQFLSRAEVKQQHKVFTMPRMPLRSVAKVEEIASLCRYEGQIGVLVGDSGTGKTTAIKMFAEKNQDVILIEVTQTFNRRVLLEELAIGAGAAYVGLSYNHIFKNIAAKLKDSGRIIIIDEAEYLKVKELELLRRLHDFTGIGLMLVGLPRLVSNLTGRRGEYAQLSSRVSAKGNILPLKADDIISVVSMAIGDINKQLAGYIQQLPEAANIRSLVNLLKRISYVKNVNNIEDVSKDVIDTARQSLILAI